ncbi:MAG: hypothetical protein IKN59_08360 [Paludibacteraceae bacterium]|nr:hypothetical protein [Paludibacteraceae bacterium]
MAKKKQEKEKQVSNEVDLGITTYRTLNKLANAHVKSLADFIADQHHNRGGGEFVIMMLLCDLLETMGHNPIEVSDTFRHYLEYRHGSYIPDVGKVSMRKGIVYIGDEAQPSTLFYTAIKEDKSFIEAQAEWFDMSDNDGKEK